MIGSYKTVAAWWSRPTGAEPCGYAFEQVFGGGRLVGVPTLAIVSKKIPKLC